MSDEMMEDAAYLRFGPKRKPTETPRGRPAIVVIGYADEHEKDVDDASPAELRRRLWLAIEALSEAADGLSRAGRPRLARRAREVVGHVERGTPMKTKPNHVACCANEHRSINGGCESCGDPCL